LWLRPGGVVDVEEKFNVVFDDKTADSDGGGSLA
jgi:hypothetical protein